MSIFDINVSDSFWQRSIGVQQLFLFKLVISLQSSLPVNKADMFVYGGGPLSNSQFLSFSPPGLSMARKQYKS